MRAGIYARISEDRDETQLGVGRQVEDCELLAAGRDWESRSRRYVDNDLSAWKGGKRPEFERMLETSSDEPHRRRHRLAPGPADPPAAGPGGVLRCVRLGRRDRAGERVR